MIGALAHCAPKKKEQKERDDNIFLKKMEHFSILEEMAIEAMQPKDSMTRESFVEALKKTALHDWVECVNLMDESEKLILPYNLQQLRTDLKSYSSERIQETLLYIKANEEGTNRYNRQIDSLHTIINTLMEKIRDSKPSGEPARQQGL